jgi:hypothetical protein
MSDITFEKPPVNNSNKKKFHSQFFLLITVKQISSLTIGK